MAVPPTVFVSCVNLRLWLFQDFEAFVQVCPYVERATVIQK